MYYIISNIIIKNLIHKGYISSKKEKSKQILVEYIIALVTNIVIAAGIGHTLKIENQLIIYSIFYTILRSSNGGNYLKLNIKNAITRWCFGIALLLGSEYMIGNLYGKIMLLCFCFISFLAVVTLAPFKAKKISLPEEIEQKLWKRSAVTVTILCAFLAVCIIAMPSSIIASAVIGIFVQSISLLPTPIVNKQIIELESYVA